MSMYGTYKIYKNGKLVLEQKNKLTILGRANILKSLLGQNQYFANSLGIGVSSLSNGSDSFLDMNDLDFTVGKYPVSTSTLGNTGTNDAIIYTARIKDTSRYSIYEVGVFSNIVTTSSNIDDFTIFNFEKGDLLKETVSGTTYYIDDSYVGKKATVVEDLNNYRIGTNAVRIDGANTIFYDEQSLDLSDVNPYDIFSVAVYSVDASKTITVVFTDINNETASYSFLTSSTAQQYNIINLTQNSANNFNNLDWSQITKISITSDSDSYIILDGLKIKPKQVVDNTEGLLSRTVLSSPIEKDSGTVIDIEYALSVNLET